MGKAFFGAFASLIAAVAITGAITWSLNEKSHQMVVDADNLKTLIDLQKEVHSDLLYSKAAK
ncbi:MAG: hypothetical protein O2909_04910 [Chloroflexi bacterium]|nr:hypothetical protein [Chloroflexota bacterium]MDA1218764.1 hypothetical protein [Chloroflexota bacterium]